MEKAAVIFSGGQDSTTCLCWAIDKFGIENIETISFDYGQRHKIELECAQKICSELNIPHRIYELEIFKELENNALIEEVEIVVRPDGLPNTFVPGRNLIFLTYAAMHAYKKDLHHLVIGVCCTDYSGYPDCRKETIDSLNHTLMLGMEYPLEIHTPLMYLSKKQTVELIHSLGYLELLKDTHTCYEGKRPPCEKCPACRLRAKGFYDAGIIDPLFSQVCQKLL